MSGCPSTADLGLAIAGGALTAALAWAGLCAAARRFNRWRFRR